MADKFTQLTDRLHEKMQMSQTPVPGFLVGLSGTDSVLALLLIYDACARNGMAHRVQGIHYVNAGARKLTWFAREVMPWLNRRCPLAELKVETPLGGNQDPQRWADLHLRALNRIDTSAGGKTKVTALDLGHNYWVVGTLNNTEFELGTYSMLAASASIMPLRKVWKSTVMTLCEQQKVPATALENARIPDCICGRDELAAANIELIDEILTNRLKVQDRDPKLVDTLIGYVHDLRQANGFKQRTPYLL
ncbi:MAG TPA: hypothetical protein VHP58_07070 [Alphaproteobacteria bacterium]|nr:hypothetical protein [Alphaproteobacteria bacterium]